MTKSALLIGINYRGQNGELAGCINDVKNVRRMLLRIQRFRRRNIRLLTEDESRKPTRAEIMEGIQWLLQGAKSGDTLYFHYSGHGSWIKDLDKDEDDGRDETLVPLDYRSSGMIVDDELREKLALKVPKGVKLTAVLDCCHSGTGMDLRWVVDTERKRSRRRRRRWYWLYTVKQHDNYEETPGEVVFISGCRDVQYSADAFIGGQNVGALTWAYLKVVYRYRRRRLSYAGLLRKMRWYLKRGGFSQKPLLGFGQRFIIWDPFTIKQ